MASKILGFNGERRDPVSQRYSLGNGYRAYDPGTMRFRGPDSWSPFGAGGMNAYAYCAGDPVNRADPTGHISWQAGLGIGLGILGILGAFFTGGGSIAAAGSLSAALATTSTMPLLIGTSALLADVTGLVSAASEQCNPQASVALGWVSFASGMLSLGSALGTAGFRMLDEATAELRQRLGNIREFGLSGRGTSGETALTRSQSATNLNVVYRYDQRSPREIMHTGFQGTRTHFSIHPYAPYKQQTVFTGQTLEGASFYRRIQERHILQGRQLSFTLDPDKAFFLYKIDPAGRDYIDFSAEYAIKGERFTEQVTRQSHLLSLGHTQFWKMTYRDMDARMNKLFLPTREVHLQGPIAPDKITPVSPANLNYLDLALW